MFVLQPDPYLLPSYGISPFSTADISSNCLLPDNDTIDEYFDKRFDGRKYLYTINGREAIYKALCYFNLQKDDVVTILTTTGNYYVSKCVTEEIEKFCLWSREIETKTKVLFVNHEFGYPYTDLKKLKEYNLPIIEDCAHSFFSQDEEHDVGNVGEFVIYSFPKMFPIQIGGLLVTNIPQIVFDERFIDYRSERYIKNVLSFYIQEKDKIIQKRISNYRTLKSKFESSGFFERFNLTSGIVPGVFMFKAGGQSVDLDELKKYYYSHGVQCSVFYGEGTFFLPVHQALSEQDLDYFYEVFKSFIKSL
jgi:hypothetical protein